MNIMKAIITGRALVVMEALAISNGLQSGDPPIAATASSISRRSPPAPSDHRGTRRRDVYRVSHSECGSTR